MLLRGGDRFFQRIPPLGLIRRHACRRHRPSRFFKFIYSSGPPPPSTSSHSRRRVQLKQSIKASLVGRTCTLCAGESLPVCASRLARHLCLYAPRASCVPWARRVTTAAGCSLRDVLHSSSPAVVANRAELFYGGRTHSFLAEIARCLREPTVGSCLVPLGCCSPSNMYLSLEFTLFNSDWPGV